MVGLPRRASMLISKIINVFYVLIVLLSPISFACEQTFRVSAADAWPPFSFKKGNDYHGVDIEIVEAVLSTAGYCWQYVSYPSSKRALKELELGNVDMLFAATQTDERSKYAHFSVSYREEEMMVFSLLEAKNVDYFSIKHLFGVSRGSVYGQDFEAFRTFCPDCVVNTNNVSERFGMLRSKRIDYVIEERITGMNYINNLGLDGIKLLPQPVHSEGLKFMFSKAHIKPDQLHKIDQAIRSNKELIQSKINSTYLKK